MLEFNRKIFVFTLLTGCVVLAIYRLCNGSLWKGMLRLEYAQDTGTFSIVKDVRGTDPYLTIKMKCYYGDGNDNKYSDGNKISNYIDKWNYLLHDTLCHDRLFMACFNDRALKGRHETHVLTFHMSESVQRGHCICTDVNGWYEHKCNGTIPIRCCLDRGIKSVLCRA